MLIKLYKNIEFNANCTSPTRILLIFYYVYTPARIKGRAKNWTGDQFWRWTGRARMDGRQILGKKTGRARIFSGKSGRATIFFIFLIFFVYYVVPCGLMVSADRFHKDGVCSIPLLTCYFFFANLSFNFWNVVHFFRIPSAFCTTQGFFHLSPTRDYINGQTFFYPKAWFISE